MGYLSNGNYPPGVSQKMIDDHFGGSISDKAADAYDFHAHAQSRIADLLSFLNANEDQIGPSYEDLMGALEDHTYTPLTIQDVIADAEAQNAEDKRSDAAEHRYEQQRDREMCA
jgi:hypothetical protein